jgi:hypothetical protein
MDNPFLRRATEFYRDTEAFLAVISPDPVTYYLGDDGKHGRLYDRLAIIEGTPGSGKTTLARIIEYPTLIALLRNDTLPAHRAFIAALQEINALDASGQKVLAYRLPLETDYREIWQLPYSTELKLGLMVTLIQARTLLGWMRTLTATHKIEDIRLISRADASASLESIGGDQATVLIDRARAVERALYKVIGSLIPPDASTLPADCTGAYRPFDVIEEFVVETAVGPRHLRPIVIMDDAHVLHREQFGGLKRWLSRRELRVGRWVLTRLDVLLPVDMFAAAAERQTDVDLPGINPSREVTVIRLQSPPGDRRGQRTTFRRMAKDMASRYLRQMQLFSTRGITNLQDILATQNEALPSSKIRAAQDDTAVAARKLGISVTRVAAITADVSSYLGDNHGEDDLATYMVRILIHRYAKRVPQSTLFTNGDVEPAKPLGVDSTVYDAAKLHLLHKYDRPYYYGIEDLCDAGSENAEQFLRLAAELVELSGTQLIRGRSATLDARTQHRTLRSTATKIVTSWNFPECDRVRALTEAIAAVCLRESLEPNAWLGSGANAYGIPQVEFDAIPSTDADLARIIHFAVAYNAINLTTHYNCKGTEWCLLELGGTPILVHGLTLKRGGFIEGTARDLSSMTRARGAVA